MTIHMINAIIFDLDGTLLNTLEDLTNSVNYVMGRYGLPAHTIEEVRSYVGNGAARLIERSVPQGTGNPRYEEMLSAFREHYAAHCEDKAAPYEGIMELLHLLHQSGYRIAIVSNKPDKAVKQLCRRFFADYVEEAVGESGERKRKPAPDMVYQALDCLSVDASRAVYVGDSEVDLQTAGNVPMQCISVTWGFRQKAQLLAAGAKEENMVKTPPELISYLDRLRQEA